jgi:hypothetical protein
MKTKKVTLLGQTFNKSVADAGESTVATVTVEIPSDMTYGEFKQSTSYKDASQELMSHPGGVDYVGVKNGTSWPMHSFSTSGFSAAGEQHA